MNSLRSLKKSDFLFLVFPATTAGLGYWQWRRLAWKTDLLERIDECQRMPSVDFPLNDLNSLNDLEYRRVHLRGSYLYDRQFVIRNRPRFDEGYQKKGGDANSLHPSSHGAHLITPMQLSNGLIVMVNRGWIPRERIDSELATAKNAPPIKPKKESEVEVDAIVRKPDNRPPFSPENSPALGNWFYKDFEAMGRWCGASPVFLDAVYEPGGTDEQNGPIGGQTNITLRNEHFNYMLFWLSLSAISLAMWFRKFVVV